MPPRFRPLCPGIKPSTFRTFCHSETATIAVFSICLLVIIFGVGALAMEAVNYENKRAAAQAALDRCAEMADWAKAQKDSGVSSTETAESVAIDCMAQSSVGSTGLTPSIVSADSKRTTTLSGTYTFSALVTTKNDSQGNTVKSDKQFTLSTSLIKELPNIEVTIAVDINNTVFWNNFRDPLRKFIKIVADPDTGQKVSFNIIPFGKSVNLGLTNINKFTTIDAPLFTRTDETRYCLLLPEASKRDIGIDMDATYSLSWPVYLSGLFNEKSLGTGNTKPYLNSTETSSEIYFINNPNYLESQVNPVWGNCHFEDTNNIPVIGWKVSRPINSGSYSSINSKIESIVAKNNASGVNDANSALAMKWALALMDPSLRDLFPTSLSSTGAVVSSDRPLAYTSATKKILIFIPNNAFAIPDGIIAASDSEGKSNSSASRVREIYPKYLNGTEPDPQIWRTPVSSNPNRIIRYSIFHSSAPGANKYWVTEGDINAIDSDAHWAATPYKYPGEGAAIQQTWRQIFSAMTVDYLIRQLYMIPLTDIGVLPNDPDYDYESLVNKFTYIETIHSNLMSDFSALCTKAKANGATIYTILGNGVSSLSSTNSALKRQHNANLNAAKLAYKACATSDSHSFEISVNNKIENIMRTIAIDFAQLWHAE